MTKFMLKLVHSPKLLVLFFFSIFAAVFFALAPFFHFFEIINLPYAANVDRYGGLIKWHALCSSLITFAVVGLLFLIYQKSIFVGEDGIANQENR